MKALISYKQVKCERSELLWDEALPVTLTLTIVAHVREVGFDLTLPHGKIRVIGVIDLVLLDLLASAHDVFSRSCFVSSQQSISQALSKSIP
jgi:hypothetical protein